MIDAAFDLPYRERYAVIAGTDEAGRGPLAGPVVAGAVILPAGFLPEGLNDSKKLSEKRRESLYALITENAVSWAVGMATAEEIDSINILNASLLAMRRAIAQLSPQPCFVLVDGNVDRGFSQPAKAVVGGDGKSPSIAAASILAKVTRDRLLKEMDAQWPQYGFAKHKGYPTKDHMLAVFEHGPCPGHRRSFLGFLEKDHDRLTAELAARKAAENSSSQ